MRENGVDFTKGGESKAKRRIIMTKKRRNRQGKAVFRGCKSLSSIG